jgi:MFS family permease
MVSATPMSTTTAALPSPVRTVLRTPGVAPVFATSLLGRLPAGAAALVLILHVQGLTGSYARGGLVAGCYALAFGLMAPVLGRLVDARGQTAVLRIGAALSASAMVALALIPAGAPLGAFIAAAVIAGAAHPPLGACMRALWPDLLPDASRHVAYSFESAAMEVVYLLGPLAIAGGIGAWSTSAAMAACGLFLLTGTLLFSFTPASARWRAEAAEHHHFGAALRSRGVRTLLVVMALIGVCFGAVEVAVPAFADAHGNRGLAGPLLAVWGAGSLVGGLLATRTAAAADPAGRVALLLAWVAIGHVLPAFSTGIVMLGALLFVGGMSVAPALAGTNGLLDRVAPRGALTESFTWLTTGLLGGISIGGVLGGSLADGPGPAWALGAAAIAAALGALLALARRPVLRASVRR